MEPKHCQIHTLGPINFENSKKFSGRKPTKIPGNTATKLFTRIEYKKPASLEDELTIRSFVKSITKTSFFMNQIITKGDDTIVEAQVHLVFVNDLGKPVKIPDEIYSKFKPYFCDSIKL